MTTYYHLVTLSESPEPAKSGQKKAKFSKKCRNYGAGK
jgi:hypothetical protein